MHMALEDAFVSDSQKAIGEHSSGFGLKKITAFGSFALLVNNMTGAAIVDIPGLFQTAGWLTPIATTLLMMVIATFASAMLCQAMAAIPNNDRFQGRIELTTLSKHFFPSWGYWATQAILNISLLSMNMSRIIVSAQAMDWIILHAFKWNGALEFYPNFGFSQVTTIQDGVISPFDGAIVLSLGFVVLAIVSVPLGYFNLNDQMWVQNVAFLLTTAVFVFWFVIFFVLGFDFSYIPVWGSNQTQVLGTTIFNYAYVITIPSWVNEKQDDVSINWSLWSSSIFVTLFFLGIGLFGGWSLQIVGDENLLDALTNNTTGTLNLISLFLSYGFPMIVLLPGIPIYSIIVRYNLVESNICKPGWANFWGVLFPWLLSIPFCTGNGLVTVINWTALFINGIINFIIPMLLYIVAKSSVYNATPGDSAVNIQRDRLPSFSEADEPYDATPCLKLPFYRRCLPSNPVYLAWFMMTLITELIVVVIVLDVVAAFV